MTEAYKVLGQEAPSATTLTTVYTVPANRQAVISSIVLCNRGAATTARVAVRPAGASIANKHYVAYDIPLDAGESIPLVLGITLDATDVISAYFGTANCYVSVFGTEIT